MDGMEVRYAQAAANWIRNFRKAGPAVFAAPLSIRRHFDPRLTHADVGEIVARGRLIDPCHHETNHPIKLGLNRR